MIRLKFDQENQDYVSMFQLIIPPHFCKFLHIILILWVELESYQKRIFLKVTNITWSDMKIRKVFNFRNLIFKIFEWGLVTGNFDPDFREFSWILDACRISHTIPGIWDRLSYKKFLSTFRNHQCGRASSTELFLIDLQSCTFLVLWRHFCKKMTHEGFNHLEWIRLKRFKGFSLSYVW